MRSIISMRFNDLHILLSIFYKYQSTNICSVLNQKKPNYESYIRFFNIDKKLISNFVKIGIFRRPGTQNLLGVCTQQIKVSPPIKLSYSPAPDQKTETPQKKEETSQLNKFLNFFLKNRNALKICGNASKKRGNTSTK